MNIDPNMTGHCANFSYEGLEHIKYIQKYSIARNGSVDWNALVNYPGDWNNYTAVKEYNRNLYLLIRYIEDHDDRFLDKAFKSHITAFE